MKIKKHSGDIVEFDIHKLEQSLLKSGADAAAVSQVLNQISEKLYDGITTKQIYKLAFALLKKGTSSHAARYNLRAALETLGPAGFYFEKYIALVFQSLGYKSKTNLNLQGRCVNHEVDVAIERDGVLKMIECKFHGSRDINSDVKVPMYILSRFNDLKENPYPIFTQADYFKKCLIVTNNRFTEDAIRFANCSGIELLSWDYPKHNNLRTYIDAYGLYPITCLTTLSAFEKEQLLLQDSILIQQLKDRSEVFENIGVSNIRFKKINREITDLCK